MTNAQVREEVTLMLTGKLLELELEPNTLDSIIKSSLRELQRYITSTKIITIPFSRCIDLADPEQTGGNRIYVSNVFRVYRPQGYSGADTSMTTVIDPIQASQWQLLSGMGNMRGFQDYSYNYMAWNTLLQTRNTSSTDLAYIFDRDSQKLYINVASNSPGSITVEYIPVYQDVSEITSDYWLDVLIRLAVAKTKIVAGRVRSRYTQSNAIWSQDGKDILAEGTAELNELRETLSSNTALFYNAVD